MAVGILDTGDALVITDACLRGAREDQIIMAVRRAIHKRDNPNAAEQWPRIIGVGLTAEEQAP